MELRFACARPLFRLRSAYADPKVPFRGIYETDRGNGKAAVSRCRQASRCVASGLARVRCRRSPSGRLPRYGYAFARNDKAVRVYAQPIKHSPLSGEGVLPKHCEGKTDEGKTALRFYKVYSPHPSLGALTLALVPPSPKGEGFNICHPITILLARFQPYLSAQPTVGRFALGPPHNVQPQIGI